MHDHRYCLLGSNDEFLKLLSPKGPVMAAAPTAEELPDYEGPDVDLSGWIDSIVTDMPPQSRQM